MIVADTNVLSEAVRREPDPKAAAWRAANDAELAIPTIVIAELAYGCERLSVNARPKRLEGFVRNILIRYQGRVLPFDTETALLYGEIAGLASRIGRPLDVADGIIAATAMRHGARLASRNTRHFDFLPVTLINPWI